MGISLVMVYCVGVLFGAVDGGGGNRAIQRNIGYLVPPWVNRTVPCLVYCHVGFARVSSMVRRCMRMESDVYANKCFFRDIYAVVRFCPYAVVMHYLCLTSIPDCATR